MTLNQNLYLPCPVCDSFSDMCHVYRPPLCICVTHANILRIMINFDNLMTVVVFLQQTWSIGCTVTPLITLCAHVKLTTDAKTNPVNNVCRYHPPPPNPPSLHPLQVPESQLQHYIWKTTFTKGQHFSILFKCIFLQTFLTGWKVTMKIWSLVQHQVHRNQHLLWVMWCTQNHIYLWCQSVQVEPITFSRWKINKILGWFATWRYTASHWSPEFVIGNKSLRITAAIAWGVVTTIHLSRF